jgi:hypothetical protein
LAKAFLELSQQEKEHFKMTSSAAFKEKIRDDDDAEM